MRQGKQQAGIYKVDGVEVMVGLMELRKKVGFGERFKWQFETTGRETIADFLIKEGVLDEKTRVRIDMHISGRITVTLLTQDEFSFKTWYRNTEPIIKSNFFCIISIWPSQSFVDFLEKFEKSIENGPFCYWFLEYGHLISACRACEKDKDAFGDLVEKAKDLDEFLKILAVM